MVDHTTGLTWQQSGSSNQMNYEDAENHVLNLKSQRFAGFSDWRLPTLEEAMSLMEPAKTEKILFFKTGLFLDPVFDKMQRWIWTSDKKSASGAWYVSFYNGHCDCFEARFWLSL